MIASLLLGLACLPQATLDGAVDHGEVDLDRVLEDATEWLLDHQQKTGAWGSHHSPRPIEVLCDVPGSHHVFRVATTGLCLAALVEGPVQNDHVDASIDRAVDYLLADWNVKRASGMEHYTIWGLGYGMQGLCTFLLDRPDDPRADEIREVVAKQIDKLHTYQCLDGGWGYLSLDDLPTFKPSFTSMSFTTASILVALDLARECGVESPPEMIEKAVDSIVRCKTPSGSYTYGELWNMNPRSGINQIKGAACRTPCCNHAVELWGEEIEVDDHARSMEDLLVRHARFQIVSLRRPMPHESHYAISGYFYLFGMAYAAYVLEDLPAQQQDRYWDPLVAMVMHTHQPDGSFWDYPLYSYHKPYGTAYAMIALSRAAAYRSDPVPTRTAADLPAVQSD